MNLADYYHSVINWPDRTAQLVALAVALGFLVVAVAILSTDRHRKLGRFLGLVGIVLIMALLWTVREQTVTARITRHITLTTYRTTERSRQALLVALVLLPAVSFVVMSSVLVTTRQRLRQLVPSRLREGRRHHAEKRYPAALRDYNEAINSSPHLAEGYFRRGCLYQTMGEKSLALADFERAIDRDARFAPAYLQRGRICLESGDYDSALADFGMLMTLRGSDPESYLNRGICLLKKGQLRDAAADFQRVLKLTNHSDFAEPAKQYLRECESGAARSLPAAGANGSVASPSPSEPIAPDFMI
jgi:tetratricopeptide (TPR) repeat protein